MTKKDLIDSMSKCVGCSIVDFDVDSFCRDLDFNLSDVCDFSVYGYPSRLELCFDCYSMIIPSRLIDSYKRK